MKLYKSDGLSDYQKFHRKVFETPKGSLSHWGVSKIEHFYRNERVIYHTVIAHVVRRVIAFAMPIFNLMDVLHFTAISAYKIVTLQPKDSGYALLKCLKSLQLFLCAFPTLLIGVIEPKLIYRTDGMWLDVKKVQVRSQITKNFEKLCEETEGGKTQVAHLKEALETAIGKMVENEDAIELLHEVLAKVISEIPTDDPNKQEIVIEQYIEMFSELLVCAENQNVELDKLTEHFTDLLELIITVRHPILRLSLIERLMTTAKNHPDIYQDIAEREYANSSRQALPYLVGRLITEDEETLDRLLTVSNDRYFKSRTNQTDFIETLHEIYESNLGSRDQETALKLFLDSFELDGKIVDARKIGRRRKGVPTSSEERDQRIAAKRRDIQEKTSKITGKEKDKRKDWSLSQKIEGLEREITALEEMELPSAAESRALLKKDKGKYGHYLAAKDVLRMLLSITDRNLVSGCLTDIAEGEKYSHLSDESIVTDIFKEVFELEAVLE